MFFFPMRGKGEKCSDPHTVTFLFFTSISILFSISIFQSIHQGIPRRSAMYSHLPQKALGIHVFPRIPTYSHVFPLVFPRPIYRLEKTFIFQFSKLYIPGIPTGNTVCCRRLCWADGIPMGIRGNTVCCRPSGNALQNFAQLFSTSKHLRTLVPTCSTALPWETTSMVAPEESKTS